MHSAPNELLQRLATHLGEVVKGKPEQIRLALTCLVARGHLLLEDVPGVGKTTLAEGLARSFSLSFARVQFTADLLPSDIIGAQIFKAATSSFDFRPGPIFHQVVLADELNRAPPRTQSALLEAMGQGQVSVDGVTHALPPPFSVIATQNPLDLAVETQLLMTRRKEPLLSFEPIASAAELVALQEAADRVKIAGEVADYAVRLAAATRTHPEIERGISTRAALALMSAARALALWDSRDFVTPLDIRTMLVPALAHRLLLRTSSQGAYARDEAGHLLEELARRVVPPR